MKKKIIGSVLVLGIVAAAAGLFVPNAVQKITKESVITSSQLEKAVDISELSTAEFIYNGIADKYSDGNLEETECHIAYASTVKVGIALDQITFTIDEEKKTVTPVLPEITVNTVTVDPDSLSFIPQNPDVELKDIMTVCKEDALKEASESKEQLVPLCETVCGNRRTLSDGRRKSAVSHRSTTLADPEKCRIYDAVGYIEDLEICRGGKQNESTKDNKNMDASRWDRCSLPDRMRKRNADC